MPTVTSRKLEPAILLKDLIKKRRLELNMSQRDVARAMGMSSVDYIGMVESGIRRLDIERLPAIARALRLPLDEIADMTIKELYSKPETLWFVEQYCGINQELVNMFRALDNDSKHALKTMAELLLAKQNQTKQNPNELRRAS